MPIKCPLTHTPNYIAWKESHYKIETSAHSLARWHRQDEDDAIRRVFFYWVDWRLPSKQYSKREGARSRTHSMFIYFDSCISYFNSEYIFIALFSFALGPSQCPLNAFEFITVCKPLPLLQSHNCIRIHSRSRSRALAFAFAFAFGVVLVVTVAATAVSFVAVAISIAIFSFKCTFYLHSIPNRQICCHLYFWLPHCSLIPMYIWIRNGYLNFAFRAFATSTSTHSTHTHTHSHWLHYILLVFNLIYHLQY